MKPTGSSSFTLPTKYRKKNCNQIVNQIITLSKREGLFVIAVRFISHSNNFFRKVSAFFVNVNVMFVPIRWLLLVRVAVQNTKMKYQT